MWSYIICTPQQAAGIPGIQYDNINRRAKGPVDAIAVVAKRQGIKLPPPLPYQKLSPGDIGLRDYQVDGVSWIAENLMKEGAALLADDMGLGKTAQAIVSWQVLRHPRLFVVCPGSVRESWRRQFKKWGEMDAFILTKGKDWAKAADQPVIVTSYELAKQVPTFYYPDMLMLDEAHNLKGRGAQRSLAFTRIAKATPMRLLMTGTPMWSRPRDLWKPLNMMFGYRFGNAEEFDFAYCAARINSFAGRDNSGISNSDELKLRLNYIMKRRLKRDVAKELPPVIREVRWVDGTKRAKEALRQALTSSGGSKFHDALEATLDDKLDVVVDTAKDFGTNVVIFTWMKKHAMELQVMMQEEGMKSFLITGDISHKQRDALIARAAKEKASLVCTIDSVKEGVDGIQYVTSNAIFHALDHLPLKVVQTISRLDRIGQKEPVTALFIAMRDSADQLVVQTVLEKLDQWTKLFGIDDSKELSKTFSTTDGKAKEMERAVLDAMFNELKEKQ